MDATSDDLFDSGKPASDRGCSRCCSPMLPPFDGSEAWEVWFDRFEDAATWYRCNDGEELDACCLDHEEKLRISFV